MGHAIVLLHKIARLHYRVTKAIVSVIALGFIVTRRIIWRLFRKRCSGTLVVLTYHSIGSHEIGRFEKQLDLLCKAGKPSFADIRGSLLGVGHHIAVTFDDGFKNFLAVAQPALAERQIPVTIFVPVTYLGHPPGWITRQGHKNADEPLMTVAELRTLLDEKIKIGSHCMTHPRLTSLGPDQLTWELSESKATLESELGTPVTLLSFPYNDYDESIANLARQLGYLMVFANIPVASIYRTDPFLRGRIEVCPEDWVLEYWLKLRGAYHWLNRAIKAKRRLKAFLLRRVAIRKN